MERLLLSAGPHFDPSRFEVGFCNLFGLEGENGAYDAALRREKLSTFSIAGTGWADLPGIVLRLARLLRRERIDVMHAHMLHATLLGGLAARVARTPVFMITRHYLDAGYTNHGQMVRSADFLVSRSATHVTAVSRAVREQLVADAGVAPSRVSVVHNGIDLDAFDAAGAAARATRAAGEVVLGIVGSLLAYKGHADLLRALPAIADAIPGVRLVVVGDGPERGALEELARALGVPERVGFVGFQADVAAWMRSFDLYVQPSHDESFGLSIVEAMAAGNPVIATTVGGIPDVVEDGVTGVLVARGDSGALARAVISLATNPAAARRMGERGRKAVEEHFTIRRVVDDFQKLYTRFAGEPKGRS